ncbi:MAG: 4-hydroxy-3-methylbut-2-enyl diphosphate reductase [Candidatus Omnitrophica bacterium]|nr:4-hydroxy-3-methylbut-2-enyl diphosphate reductase [Candidatus Omnitrophota bacterium]
MSETSGRMIGRLADFGTIEAHQHAAYSSAFVRRMIEAGGEYVSPRSGVRYRIPSDFGFCYGVEKSIDMAFETLNRFPKRRIFLTHEVIHNPRVTRDLKKQNVSVLVRDERGRLDLSAVESEDVVVIAAFGARREDVEALKQRGCLLVDTTCGAIVRVWKRVEAYAKKGFTSVIHGVFRHEEVQATASQTASFGGHYLVIRDLEEASMIGRFLEGEMNAEDFVRRYDGKASEGFDPRRDLDRVGIASQTTMFKSETLKIQDALAETYRKIYGAEAFGEHFMIYDTICSATQERQDALAKLLEEPHDLFLVIGGFASSNTTHLSEIASARVPTYHIEGAEDILSAGCVRHMDPGDRKVHETRGWLAPGVKSVGLTTGASTPDVCIEEVIVRLEHYLEGR